MSWRSQPTLTRDPLLLISVSLTLTSTGLLSDVLLLRAQQPKQARHPLQVPRKSSLWGHMELARWQDCLNADLASDSPWGARLTNLCSPWAFMRARVKPKVGKWQSLLTSAWGGLAANPGLPGKVQAQFFALGQ